MSSTTTQSYTPAELRRDAARVVELTREAQVALSDAATILGRIEAETAHLSLSFTFSEVVRTTASGLIHDLSEENDVVSVKSIVEYAADLEKIVRFASSKAAA